MTEWDIYSPQGGSAVELKSYTIDNNNNTITYKILVYKYFCYSVGEGFYEGCPLYELNLLHPVCYSKAKDSYRDTFYSDYSFSSNSYDSQTMTQNITFAKYINFVIRKVWVDDDNRDNYRPNYVKMKLLRNGEECFVDCDAINYSCWNSCPSNILSADNQVNNDSDVWEKQYTYPSWSDLFNKRFRKYDADGNEYTFSIIEEPVTYP